MSPHQHYHSPLSPLYFVFLFALIFIQPATSIIRSQAIGQQLWFLGSQGESCDQTCAKASFGTVHNESLPQHARSCDVSAFQTISTEQVKSLLFQNMIVSPACSCTVQAKINTVAGLVPYSGGVGGADCTGEPEHGCVYSTVSNGLTLATCEASQPAIFRLCPCKKICKLFFFFFLSNISHQHYCLITVHSCPILLLASFLSKSIHILRICFSACSFIFCCTLIFPSFSLLSLFLSFSLSLFLSFSLSSSANTLVQQVVDMSFVALDPTSTVRRAFGVGTRQAPTGRLHVTLHASASSSGRTFTLPTSLNGLVVDGKAEDGQNSVYSNTDKWFHTYVHHLSVVGISNTMNKMPILAGHSNGLRLFYVASGRSLSLTNIQIQSGGIYINRGNGHFDTVIFSENVAKDNQGGGGGALLVHASANVTVQHCTFVNNSAIDRGGGAIHLRPSSGEFGSTLTIKDSTFRGNRAHLSGGAISIDDLNMTSVAATSIVHVNLHNTTFLDNVVSNVYQVYRVGSRLVANGGFQCLKSDGISWSTDSWYGSLADAKRKCNSHPDCKILHDYNNDGMFCFVTSSSSLSLSLSYFFTYILSNLILELMSLLL